MILLFTTSCEDDDKTNSLQILKNAPIVTMHIDSEDININASNPESFIAEVDAFKVSSYNLDVVRISNGITSESMIFNTYTSFPFSLQITLSDLANTFSVNESDILVNDRFEFLGTTTADDGTVFTIENFTAGNGFIPGVGSLQFNSDGYEFTVRIINQ